MELEKNFCWNTICDNSFSLSGDADDLYYDDGDYKEIKIIHSISDDDDSSVGLALYSIDRSGKHDFLKRFLGKKIKICIAEMKGFVQTD